MTDPAEFSEGAWYTSAEDGKGYAGLRCPWCEYARLLTVDAASIAEAGPGKNGLAVRLTLLCLACHRRAVCDIAPARTHELWLTLSPEADPPAA